MSPKIPLMAVGKSSNVHAVGYDPSSQTLSMQFKSGGHIYHYAGVPPELHAAMMASTSIGSFHHRNIKSQLPFTKEELP